MTIFVFGNPDLPVDALPVRLVSKLKAKFPRHEFFVKDPNEEWDVPEKLMVIDTVKGINEVKQFNSLDSFTSAPRVSMHDFDALTQLRFLQKLGKLKEVTIIGVPPEMDEQKALECITPLLKKYKYN
jgi:Ni,Fe-hydrogenase maturation factor